MTKQEADQILEKIAQEFETLGKKLARRGMFAQEWGRALLPIEFEVAQNALRRWVWKFNTEPTLDRFISMVDELRTEAPSQSQYPQGMKPINTTVIETMENLSMQERTPDDILWAKSHVKMAQQLVSLGQISQAQRDEIMVSCYQEITKKYQQFEIDCQCAIDDLGIGAGDDF